jgi:hypothetical protein
MTKSEKNKLLTTNTILWLTAMVIPFALSLAFASAKFPWPLILPFLFLGPLLASNGMLSKAIGPTTEDLGPK